MRMMSCSTYMLIHLGQSIGEYDHRRVEEGEKDKEKERKKLGRRIREWLYLAG